MTDIQKCNRELNESPSQFANMFNGSVSWNSVNCGSLDVEMESKFVVLMLRNTKL